MSETLLDTKFYADSTDEQAIMLVRPAQDSVLEADTLVERLPKGQVTDLVLANETGSCGGVEMAEYIMDALLAHQSTQPEEERVGIYANHPPSKGADRARLYKDAGVLFGVDIDEIPPGDIYLFSAHGAHPAEVARAEQRGLRVIDTTCPLVGHIYSQIKNARKTTKDDETLGVVYIATSYLGTHPEVIATKGVAEQANARFIPLTSREEAELLASGSHAGPEDLSLEGLSKVIITGLTTNNSEATQEIAEVFTGGMQEPGPEVIPYNQRSVCNTVKHRQNAARQMVRDGVETLIVVGALESNNTNELVSAALDESKKSQSTSRLESIVYANTAGDVPPLKGSVGIVSGASTQQPNIDQIIHHLNVPASRTTVIGQTDKANMFRPMGGSKSLARRVLDNDFTWLG